MRAVILQHEPQEDLDLLERPLRDEGFQLVRRFRGVEHADLAAELVVVPGGALGVGDTAQHPFLQGELALLAERQALGRPTLGLCLGAQPEHEALLARLTHHFTRTARVGPG